MEITELSFTFANFPKGEIDFFVQTQKVHNAKTHIHKKGGCIVTFLYNLNFFIFTDRKVLLKWLLLPYASNIGLVYVILRYVTRCNSKLSSLLIS
jgi:hypothetical protein